MKFLCGNVYAAFVGSSDEFRAVYDLLKIEDNPSFLDGRRMLYTGLVDFVQEQLSDKFPVEIVDETGRAAPAIADIHFPEKYIANGDPNYEDRDYQLRAAKKAIHKGRGVVEIATGGGKTEVAIMISKYLIDHGLAKKVYIVSGTQFLMNQSATRFERRGMADVSRFGGGHDFEPAQIQCCVSDSLIRAIKNDDPIVCSDFASCDVIFFDECHHLSAQSWVRIGEVCPAPYRFGLTATLWSDPFKYSYGDFFLLGLAGGLVAHVPSIYLRNRGYLANPLVTMVTVEEPRINSWRWADVYEKGIVEHRVRNSLILSLGIPIYNANYRTLIFVTRIPHGLALVQHLRNYGCKNVYFVKGGEEIYEWIPSGRWSKKRTSIEELAELVNSSEQITIVGTSVLDEGIDIPSFNVLFMGSAMMKYRRSIQRAGRGMRPKPGDNRVYIFDFIDCTHSMLEKHSDYRLRTYELEEFEFAKSLQEASDKMKVQLELGEDLYNWASVQKLPKKGKKKREVFDGE